MITNAKNSIMQWLSLSNIVFVLLFLFTFDKYSLDFVTPETPFFTIAKLPFLRVEFIAIVFALAFAAGAVIATLLRKHSTKLIQISTLLIGVVALILGIVDVNFFQILFPTMRISHVIMSVSRMTGIVLGVSGLFVGMSIACCITNKTFAKSVVYGAITAAALALVALSENWYNFIYILVGAVTVLVTVMSQYCGIDGASNIPKSNFRKSAIKHLAAFFGAGALALTAVLGYQYLIVALQASVSIYALTMSIALVLFFLCAKFKFHGVSKVILAVMALICWIINLILPTVLLTVTAIIISAVALGAVRKLGGETDNNYVFAIAAGVLVGAVVAYVLNHYFSEVTTYSGNRVVYEVNILAWLAPIAMAALYGVFALISNKRKAIICADVN